MPKHMQATAILYCGLLTSSAIASQEWTKHTIVEGVGTITTAVAADYNGDRQVDVITSYKGQIVLHQAPHWEPTTLYTFHKTKSRAIHSESFDVDGDGDIDYIASDAWAAPFWLENPGRPNTEWTAHIVDPDIRGIHCILKTDVDQDGQLDLIINNFIPEGPLANSIFWLSKPNPLKNAPQWNRYAFADGDAIGGSHYFGVGDIDGDGWKEIAVGSKGGQFEGGHWFAYWKHPGAQQVTQAWEKVIIAENQTGATNILPADVNNDGQIDFIASRGHGHGVIWFQAPDWQEHAIDAEISSPHALAIADFDQDGDIDAASCGFKSERLAIYTNDGNGNFTTTDLDHAQQSYDLRAIDLDNDGDLDLLNAGRATANVVWYENPLK